MKVAIVACLHGNEPYGVEVAARLPSFFSFIVNEKALQAQKRFLDEDINRCFPGKQDGNHEERLAFDLVNTLCAFDAVIDLHSSSEACPLFGIITKPTTEKIEIAKKLGLKKLVIMPDDIAGGKALIDVVKNGISLEVGPHNRKENVREVIACFENFQEGTATKHMKIFQVFQVVQKEQATVLIKNFEEIKKGSLIAQGKGKQFAKDSFTAVLVNEKEYEGVLCLAAKRLT